MKNVFMDPDKYHTFRHWLRTTNILWRDLRTSCMIMNWGETACLSAFRIGDKTSAQVAYDIVKMNYPTLSLKWRKDEFGLLNYRAPQVFTTPVLGEIGYLDIRATYWQLYQYLFFHSNFPFRRQKYPLWDISRAFCEKFSPEWKAARSAVIGIARSTKNKMVQGDKVYFVDKVNNYLSPTLWAQIMGILNQFALDMLNLGAIWVNVDGYAFTDIQAYYNALNYFGEKGITIGDKGIGYGFINGVNSVHIQGVKETKENQTSSLVYHLETAEIDFYNQWNLNRRALQ